MLDAARRVERRLPGTQFLVPLAPGLDPLPIRAMVAGCDLSTVRLHAGDFPAILTVCRAGVVASGTASLEAAVAGLPIVVVYRMHPLSYAVGRTLVRVEHIGLPNLVAGRRVVPELVQGACTPERIATELLRYLEQPAERERVVRALAEIPPLLGGPGVFERAADAVLRELAAREALA
jgi:lipid-A-disaccharide synthase